MSKNLVRVRLLRVTRCQDSMMWYAPLVGEYVPCLGLDHGEWKSRQPSGFSNFIAEDNARVVHVFVHQDKLSEYPYKYAQVERPVQSDQVVAEVVAGHVPAPSPWPEPPKDGCKTRCDMLGVCRGLPDCEEALGRAMQAVAKPKVAAAQAVGQSRRASMNEAVTNIVLGFGISVAITAVLLPALGHQVTLTENVAMTCVFTVASFVRAYAVRRLFNWWLLRQNQRADA